LRLPRPLRPDRDRLTVRLRRRGCESARAADGSGRDRWRKSSARPILVRIVAPFVRTVLGCFTQKAERVFLSLGGWQPADGDPCWPEHVEVIEAWIVDDEEGLRWLATAHPELTREEVVL
jgi:hypothetical protein